MAEAKIKVTADASQATRELAKLDQAMASINNSAAVAGKALAVVTAAAGAIAFAISKTLNSVDELAKSSRQLGMTAADLQAFRNSASLAGVSSDQLGTSLQRLQVNIGNALVKGTGPAKDALDRLGISLEDISGLGADQQFSRIAEQIAKIPDPAQRAAVATELLGRQGPRLLEAADQFERMKREAEQLGIALSTTDTAAIERANDAMSELSMITTGFMQKLAAEVAPILIVIADRIKQSVLAMGGLDTIIRQHVMPAFKLLVQVVAALMGFIAAAKIMVLVAAFGKLALAVVSVARAFRTLGVAAAAAKAIATGGLSAIVTATAGVAGAIVAAKAAGSVMDSVFDDVEIVMAEIAEHADSIQHSVEDTVPHVQIISDEVKKAAEAYQVTVNRLKENARLQLEILSHGEQEAKIRQTIRQEQEKYAGANGEIIRDLMEQDQLLQSINSRQQQVNSAINSMMDRDESMRLQAYSKLIDAQNDLTLAVQRGEAVTIAAAQSQVQALQQALNTDVVNTARSKVEILRIEDDAAKQIENINANLRNLIAIGFDQENSLYQQLADQKIKIAEDTARKLQQIDLRRIEQTLMAEQRGSAAVLSTQDKALLQRQGAEQRQRSIVADRIEFEKKSELEKTTFALDNMQTVFAALGQQNKKAFEASKALAIASALVNTYQAATKALATFPFPFGLIAAAGAVAAGMAQVSAIRGQQYSGRQLGGPVMGNKSFIVGENGPEMFTPTTNGSVVRNGDLPGGGATNINFTIVANDAQGFDDLLSARTGMIKQMISDAMIERGQRSMI